MSVKPEADVTADQMARWYGDCRDGSGPTPAQWQRLFARPADAPLTLINFFKFRPSAVYEPGTPETEEELSGEAAFGRYAAVSMPTMERVGGSFLLVGPSEGMFLGAEEDWDLIAVGHYPNTASCVALYADTAYRAAFRHRTAACARQKVFVCSH